MARLTAEVLCVSCLEPVGIHCRRCTGCARQQCPSCYRRAKSEDRSGLCWCCQREYERDMAAITRAEEEADARRVNVKEWSP